MTATRSSRPPATARPMIAVIGASRADAALEAAAEAVGAGVARGGAVLVCGGLGGVMAAACRGAKDAGGTTVGLLPGEDRRAGNPWLDVAIPTGLGEGRNLLVVRSADALIAVGGGWGTLSEIALACRTGRPVVGLRTWALQPPDGSDSPIVSVDEPADAVAVALRLAGDAATFSGRNV
ncbi:MAG TPA: TIGR00725 family protein [Egibacteraceae bacterium]